MNKKILITGGLGNLGSWLTDAFVSAGYDVFVLSRGKRPVLENLSFSFIHCDITKIADCRDKLAGHHFQYVIHAASANDNFEPEYYQTALATNALGTHNLLEVLSRERLKNFIYFSTFHVYGAGSGEIDENSPLLPKNDYASTHLFAEYYVKQFHYSHNLPFTIIRLTNSYGCPKEHSSSKWYLVMNDLARTAFEQQQIILKSNGLVLRDFIWMGTVAEVMVKLVQSPTAPNDTFNLSGEATFRMIQIAEYVQQVYAEEYGKTIPIQVNPEDTNQHDYNLKVSSEKLKQVVPFEDRNMFKEEIQAVFALLK